MFDPTICCKTAHRKKRIEVSCKILGFQKLTWISSIWSDNLLQNCASETRSFLQNLGAQKSNLNILYLIRQFAAKLRIRKKKFLAKSGGSKKVTWISSIWSDNLLQNCASEKRSFLQNLGAQKKVTWISSIWSDNLLQNCASEKKEVSCKIWGLKKSNLNIFYLIRQFAAKLRIRKKKFLAKSGGSKKVTWISSIWSDNLLQNCASEKRSFLQNLGAQKKVTWISSIWSDNLLQNCASEKKRSFLQNLGAQKINLNIFYLIRLGGKLFLPTRTCVFCSKHFCLRVKLVKEAWNTTKVFAENISAWGTGGAGKRKPDRGLSSTEGLWVSLWIEDTLGYYMKFHGPYSGRQQKLFYFFYISCFNIFWSDNLLQNCASEKRSFLQNLGAQKINLNIFYLIRRFAAKLRIRKKRSFLQNLGAQKINLNIVYLIRLGGKLFLPTRSCVFCSKHFCLRVKLVKEAWNTTKVFAENISACGTGGGGKEKTRPRAEFYWRIMSFTMNRRYFRILHEISWTLLRAPTEIL